MAQLQVTLTCPSCGQSFSETMPENQCVIAYECPGCQVLLQPKPGDCCVFCSYGDKRCPFVQDGRPCPDDPLPGDLQF